MKDTEIRIGNWFHHNTNWSTRNENKKEFDFQFEERDWYNNAECLISIEDDLSAIQLTEEWLLRFGFKKTERRLESVYNLGIFEYATSCGTVDLEIQHIDGVATYTTETKHVHQLQNLYFALTGEELTIK